MSVPLGSHFFCGMSVPLGSLQYLEGKVLYQVAHISLVRARFEPLGEYFITNGRSCFPFAMLRVSDSAPDKKE